MKPMLKVILTFLFSFTVLFASAYLFWYKPKFTLTKSKYEKKGNITTSAYKLLKSKADSLKTYAITHKYNSSLCFMIDMSIHSGKNRFFVFDIDKDSVLCKGLVAHGSCDDGFQLTPSFSNTVNSGCSCLGKFKIGGSYNGRFGIAYKLYGLDATNSNAYERNIVLHSYECVPESETYPVPVCNSRGCPMVSPGFLEKIKPYIKESKKPLLLWIFK
jgi:hypothetical protein